MEKKLILTLGILTVSFIVGTGVFAQFLPSGIPSSQSSFPSLYQHSKSFSGLIANVDQANRWIFVKYGDKGMGFYWSDVTMVAGFPEGREMSLGDLAEGTPVTVYYNEGITGNLVAERVQVDRPNIRAFQEAYPYPYLFGCGRNYC
jgi:hypothetical protein